MHGRHNDTGKFSFGIRMFVIGHHIDMVLLDGFAVFADNGDNHLTPRHRRRDTPFTVLYKWGVLPTKITSCFSHFPVYEIFFECALHHGGRTVDIVIVCRGKPIDTLFAAAIVDLDMASVTLRHPGIVAGVALHLVVVCRYRIHRYKCFFGEFLLLFE